tara:strand:+ start:928 stop:1029 length:102 start_codon:yes stop_codon:yes gene_type:complete
MFVISTWRALIANQDDDGGEDEGRRRSMQPTLG